MTGPPRLDIGVAEGDPARELSNVVGAAITPDGTLVVADGLTSELRFFDSTGAYLRTVGGEGEGPGEFVAIASLALRGDSLIVRDARTGRISILDDEGELRGISAAGAPLLGLLADGRLVSYDVLTREMPPPGSITRSRGALLVHPPEGGPGAVVAEFPMNDRYVHTEIPGFSERMFGRETEILVGDDGIVVADPAAPELRELAPGGTLRRLIRWDAPTRFVTEADAARFIELRLADYRPERRNLLAPTLRDQPPPETMPAFGRSGLTQTPLPDVVIDAERRLWVLDYLPFPEDPPTWRVFAPEGRLIASVTLPVGTDLAFANRRSIVSVRRDALDVEHVVVWDLDARLPAR